MLGKAIELVAVILVVPVVLLGAAYALTYAFRAITSPGDAGSQVVAASSTPRLSSTVTGQLQAAASPIASITETPASTATQQSATHTPVPTNTVSQPSVSPAPTASQAPVSTPTPSLVANFSGSWLIRDTVTAGEGMGQVFEFVVVIAQDSNLLSGGNSGMSLAGVVEGSTARVTFRQPNLGYSGSFSWTLVDANTGAGTFTSSVPNQGTSQILRTNPGR